MERIGEYSGFAVWFLGLGYIIAWALMPESVGALPASLHAIGLAALMFLPLPLWGYLRRRNKSVTAATSLQALARDYHHVGSPPAVTCPKVKPRSHFGLRGMTRPE
ncbi:MAG: hypothetical protein ACR2K5_16630 [Pseudolabrys sp.]